MVRLLPLIAMKKTKLMKIFLLKNIKAGREESQRGRRNGSTVKCNHCNIVYKTEETPKSSGQLNFHEILNIGPTVPEEDNNLFGPEKEDIKKQLLTSEDEYDKVSGPFITLWGPAGLGKTSLAKQIYDEMRNQGVFQAFAWVSMSKALQPEKVMQLILAQLVPSCKKRVMETSYLEVMEELYTVQQEKKCLIVLCNLRDRAKWEALRMGFLVNGKAQIRSWVLLTTRDKSMENVGRSFRITPLNEEQSRKLLMKSQNQEIGSTDSTQTRALKDIINFCQGSRLAIEILSTAYLNRTRSPDEWDKLSNYLMSKRQPSDGVQEIVQHVLSFCCAELSDHQIRKCFLYLGHFPEAHNIQLDELYIQWIDELFVQSHADDASHQGRAFRKNVMDFPKQYLTALADRSLIQMVKQETGSSIGCTKSCTLHPLVRDFCIKEARTETLYQLVEHELDPRSVQPQMYSEVNRLSLINYQSSHPFQLPKSTHLCSLSFFNMSEPRMEASISNSSREELVDIMDPKCLKFLKLYGMDFRVWDILYEIGGLIHLTHLSFSQCYNINILPHSIGSLSQLETLDLRIKAHCEMLLPNVLWNLSRLRHLYFPKRYECIAGSHGEKLDLSTLEKLVILVNFNARVCDVCHLGVMKKLEIVDIIVEEDQTHLDSVIDFMDKVFLNLHNSSLDIRNFNCYSKSKRDVLNKLLCFKRLNKLRLDGIIKALDNTDNICPNLTELEISGAELKEDPMPKLGQILKLRSLILRNDAYVGETLVCSKNDFPELRNLKLKNLRCIENWIVKEGSMLKLSRVSIGKCRRLRTLPDGTMAFLAELKELKVIAMPEEFVARLQVVEGKEGEDAVKVKQIRSIKI